MALAQAASGTQSATINTTHTLATVTTGKTCVLYVDLINMVAGDIVELEALEPALAAGVARAVTKATFGGVQAQPMAMSIPYAAMHSVAFTLKQTAGTGRSFPWSVRTLD